MILTLDEVKQIREEIEKDISYKNNEGQLDCVLHTIDLKYQGNDQYPTVYLKCAYLLESICTEHFFYDGNKRTSLLVAKIFMMKNG